MEWVKDLPSALEAAGTTEVWMCDHGPFEAVVWVGTTSCRTLLSFDRIPFSDSTADESGACAIARATNTLDSFGRKSREAFR